MRRIMIAMAVAAGLALTGTATEPATATADPVPGPPYVDHTAWVHWGDLSTLRVYPTPAARAASVAPGTLGDADEAWTEVLNSAPDADFPGMKDQFLCHWQYAEIAQPGKTSWNLEPWRPVVDYDQM